MSQALALAFLEAGDTVGGEPLIVMHGLFGSARNWQMHVKRFAERRHVFALAEFGVGFAAGFAQQLVDEFFDHSKRFRMRQPRCCARVARR